VFAEPYPVKNTKSNAYNFQGPLSTYLKNGSHNTAMMTGTLQ